MDNKFTIKALIPSQYIADWTDDDGNKFRIFSAVNIDEWEIKKCFVTPDKYKELDVNSVVKKGEAMQMYELTFETNQEDRDCLVGIKKV